MTFSFVDVLRGRAETQPHRLALEFAVADGEYVAFEHAELDRRARAVAALVQERGTPGGRVLLVHQPGPDYVSAFFGCLYAGAVAVPIYPPTGARGLERVAAVVADAGAELALTDSATLARLADGAGAAALGAEVHWAATDALDPDRAQDWSERRPRADDLAFLQYTSGSTGSPKGVMVSHGNLVHNSAVIARTLDLDEESRGVSWLPPYHDMGLIGGILQPLHTGFPCTLLSPLAFMYRPARWLRELDRTRATITAAPDFAYGEAVRRTKQEERDALDLSALRHALVGAEPVRTATLDTFAEHFRSTGFSRSAFYPCYGLAEATLFVSGGARPAQEPAGLRVRRSGLDEGRAVADDGPQTRELVGCGWAHHEDLMLLVDPESGRPVPSGEVGEVWVSGPTVALGYWQRPGETAAAFGARAEGHPDRTFLRTGDLGFRHGDELFLTGRIKDLMIVRGRNHYAPDLEQTAEAAHPLLQPGRSAAFTVDDGSAERIVLVHEVRARAASEDAATAIDAVRAAVVAGHGVMPDEVVLVRMGAVPRTSSGKIRRSECRTRWLAGDLTPVASGRADAPAAAATAAGLPAGLAALVATTLETTPGALAADVPLIAQGLDSLRAMRLVTALEEEHGVTVPLAALLGGLTPQELTGLRADGAEAPADPPERDRDGRLTPAQERMWLLDRMGAGGAYHVAGGLRLTGPLDTAALEECVARLIADTPALRSVFPPGDDGLPGLAVRPPGGHRLPALDLSGEPDPAVREARAQEALRDLAAAPFDLATGPLVRLLLIELGPGERLLGLAAHHIVLDGWSLGLLLHRLGTTYRQAVEENAPPPAPWSPDPRPAPPAAFTDDDDAFWRAQLGTAEPVALPTDHPAYARPNWRGASVPVGLAAGLMERLRTVAADRGATPFMVLAAAFGILLGRWSGQDDLVIGAAVSGRGRPADACSVGLLADTMPVRVDLRPGPDASAPAGADFATVLDRVRATCLAAYARPGRPFDEIVRAVGGRPDGGRAPVVRTLLALQNLPVEPWEAGDVRAEPFELPAPGAQFELSVHLSEGPDGSLAGHAVYAAGLFDEATVTSLLSGLPTLLGAVLDRPTAPVAGLPLLAPADGARLARTVADGGPAAADGLVHHLVGQAARDFPDTTAVAWDDGVLTYRELMARVRHLAARLRALGVTPDQPVAVCLPRSADLVVALCGVLAAGGACLPLDPSHPPARLARHVTGTAARVLIGTAGPSGTAHRVLGGFDEDAPALAVLCPEEAGESPAAPGVPPLPAPRLHPANLANVLHTSGSTGAPKAVMTTHAALANRLAWMQREYGLRPGEAVLHKTPVSFDVAGWELLWPLTVGATVVLARPEGHRDPYYLARLIARHRVTTCHFVPSMLHAFLEEPAAGMCARVLRRVVCSGEELPPALAERFAHTLPGVELHNLYGPTEAAIDVSAHRVGTPAASGMRVPIGRPIAGTRLYVLDAAGHVAPPQAPGELHIAGLAPARGYLGRPGLTAERFVPDPFVPGARLYRTGDLARYLTDGSLEYLGRLDRQLKIRGQRVEPAEIEIVLNSHPAVELSAVVARPGPDGRLRLAAWAVPARSAAPDPGELRDFLARRLPPGLVPETVGLLAELPVGPHGKLAPQLLPDPVAEETAHRVGGGPRTAPRDAVEYRMAGIWTEVLGIRDPSVTDDFFALGGHSLLATRVAVRVRASFGVELPVGELLGGGPLTIERLAALVQSRQLDQAGHEEVGDVLEWISGLSDEEVEALLADGWQGSTSPDIPHDTQT
ncbi:non-ribosomal peptide synthetase [Streptomyces caelestis]|uniref:Amino acid adenylation domain-containing protein n=1 Tax=Streptomyces caelestis TaxID=36816 RepID=A0A7W9LW67_9ACTN|nr:non-ribosomal peptide synthetase [Streptomyces caelestis]MBB5798535.1 amino acid adenylation domain-containing protein [Streptomyces caelestis]GGW51049.1 non-ribosomal peptide synthetase [Streptomyces caelestis]